MPKVALASRGTKRSKVRAVLRRRFAVVSACKPSRRQPEAAGAPIPFLEERRRVIQVCLRMNAMGINQGTSGNASCRVPGGFLVTASGIPYEVMKPEQVVFMNLSPGFFGDFMPSSEWRMHYDIYMRIPDAQAVVHAHPTYCTALSCQRRGIPSFHYMVAAAGGREILCTDYKTFGTQDLSDEMIRALAGKRSVLLGNHGMICYEKSLEKALWLANETECLARQYVVAEAAGLKPTALDTAEMDVMLAKFKSYGKQPSELGQLSLFEQKHAIEAPVNNGAEPALPGGGLPHLEQRQKVIDICLRMNAMGINQGTSGNVSCRVPGGFVVTASGIPYDVMTPEQVVFMDVSPARYYGRFMPTSEWRLHRDIYANRPDAQAIVHAHPTYCTALSTLRRDIPSFHYMVAAAGGGVIKCAEYQSFGTQALSSSLLHALGDRKSALLANHGMICHHVNLEKALWLANETEILAKQYLSALSTGIPPSLLDDAEMNVMLAKFKTYGKQPGELGKLTDFERKHAIKAPRFMGPMCACCEPPPLQIDNRTRRKGKDTQ